MQKELFKKIDTYKNTVIDLQTHMIACPAVSPHQGGLGEKAKADYIFSVLKGMKSGTCRTCRKCRIRQ